MGLNWADQKVLEDVIEPILNRLDKIIELLNKEIKEEIGVTSASAEIKRKNPLKKKSVE